MGVYRYVLIFKPSPNFFGRINCWSADSKWPRPNGGLARIFKDRDEAEMFLNKHRKMRRDVDRWKPFRVHINEAK